MACLFEVILPPFARNRMMEIHHLLGEVDRLEQLMTAYREDSHLSEINRLGSGGPVGVHEDLFPLLVTAERLWIETGGAFDVTTGPLSRLWGFFSRSGRVPDQSEIDDTLEKVGMGKVELNPHDRTVRFKSPVELNLGGIGKGYALDFLSRLLLRAGFADLLIHAGNSSILALGSYERDCGPGWPLGLQHPVRAGTDIALLSLRDLAMSTSGIREQRFAAGGRQYGHVIDPRTGWPAERRLSATALAGSAAEADALSTAFFIMSDDEVGEFCESKGKAGAILMSQGEDTGVSIKTFGLSDNLVEVLCE